MQEILDEVLEKVAALTDEDREKLIEVLQNKRNTNRADGGKGIVHPNTIWIKENHTKFAGKHVALKDGELIAVGKTIKEVDLKAKEKGVKDPLLTYLFPLDREPFGGW